MKNLIILRKIRITPMCFNSAFLILDSPSNGFKTPCLNFVEITFKLSYGPKDK